MMLLYTVDGYADSICLLMQFEFFLVCFIFETIRFYLLSSNSKISTSSHIGWWLSLTACSVMALWLTFLILVLYLFCYINAACWLHPFFKFMFCLSYINGFTRANHFVLYIILLHLNCQRLLIRKLDLDKIIGEFLYDIPKFHSIRRAFIKSGSKKYWMLLMQLN